MKIEKMAAIVPQRSQTGSERETHSRTGEDVEKAPAFRVQTDLKAGWVPGQYWDDWISAWLG